MRLRNRVSEFVGQTDKHREERLRNRVSEVVGRRVPNRRHNDEVNGTQRESR